MGQRPVRAAGEHGVHLGAFEADRPGAADPGGNLGEERIREKRLMRLDLGPRQTGGKQSHAAGDVEADAAGRDHALVRVEGRHAADREAVAPVGIGHGVGRLQDTRQPGHVRGLLEDLVVHLLDQIATRVDHRRHPHARVGLDAPFGLGDAGQFRQVHRA